ncbi:hypothetical protein [Streptomyces avermitilis]|uniref:hypothetical protein n=1 Tax=Streptomyces avermitilis TaxID=33903 RepID=UPI00369DAA11
MSELEDSGLLGGYRRELGWGNGRALGARTAVGPEFPEPPPSRGPALAYPAPVTVPTDH